MLKKTVANKLKDFLMNERENAAIEFIKWLDEKFYILPGGMDLKKLYDEFLRLNPNVFYPLKNSNNDNVQQHKTTG